MFLVITAVFFCLRNTSNLRKIYILVGHQNLVAELPWTRFLERFLQSWLTMAVRPACSRIPFASESIPIQIPSPQGRSPSRSPRKMSMTRQNFSASSKRLFFWNKIEQKFTYLGSALISIWFLPKIWRNYSHFAI